MVFAFSKMLDDLSLSSFKKSHFRHLRMFNRGIFVTNTCFFLMADQLQLYNMMCVENTAGVI